VKAFFDSSAFAKRYIEEYGSQRVDDIAQQASELGLSIICFPEITSALARKVREKDLSQASYAQIKYQLAEDVQDAQIINLTASVIECSIHLLESNALRSLDALHIACALEWQADLFASSDKRQIMAAKQANLNVEYIGTGLYG